VSSTDLHGRTVVVTGGTRGIGRAVVLEAVRRGARVVCCARDVHRGGPDVEAAAAVIAGPGRVLAMQADVSRESDVEQLFETARTRFGHVDIAVNNAGTSASELMVSHSVSEWDRVVATNITGCLLVARELVRGALARGRQAALVTVGSIAQEGAANNASYSATKGALLGMTQGLARDYEADGIRANLVVAGYVDTELARGLNPRTRAYWLEYAPARRSGTAEEIAGLVLFLASDRSRSLNGQALFATGGLLQCPA
jgi:3-oxoacyl-[acyl-carrier protein] reductase